MHRVCLKRDARTATIDRISDGYSRKFSATAVKNSTVCVRSPTIALDDIFGGARSTLKSADKSTMAKRRDLPQAPAIRQGLAAAMKRRRSYVRTLVSTLVVGVLLVGSKSADE
jgi:hypothetical protein